MDADTRNLASALSEAWNADIYGALRAAHKTEYLKERFEKWVASPDLLRLTTHSQQHAPTYVRPWTQGGWAAWQAQFDSERFSKLIPVSGTIYSCSVNSAFEEWVTEKRFLVRSNEGHIDDIVYARAWTEGAWKAWQEAERMFQESIAPRRLN